MRVLIFGRGVIGTQYGWALERAGHVVTFYVRPGRMAQYGRCIDLDILDARQSVRGRPVREQWPATFIETIPVDHSHDLIVLSVPHFRFAEAAEFVGPRAGNASILVFNNFWEDPVTAATALPYTQIVWGFPGAGGGFDDAGVLRGAFLKSVQFGTFNKQLTARERAVRDTFRSAGFGITEHADFRGWLWAHFALNAGLHAQALQAGSIAQMMGSTAQGKQAVLNVREALAVLAARGVRPADFPNDVKLFELPSWIGATALKAAYRLHPPTRKIVDAVGSFEEMRAFCRDLLAEAYRLRDIAGEARREGVATPRLEAMRPLYEQMTAPAVAKRL